MKPNPVPKENCTHEEAVSYLETHIQNLNEQLKESQEAYKSAEAEQQTRAWAMDRAIRLFEKNGYGGEWSAIENLANSIYEYARLRKAGE